jgi:hypothetical protein
MLAGVAQLPSESVMSASRLMSPSQAPVREQSRHSSSHTPPPSVQYKTIRGCIVSRPGWHIETPRISLQSVSQSLISGFGGLSYHLDRLGKQLSSGGRSSMVAENQAPRLRLAGRWNKDKSASDMDGYGKSLDLMGIHGESCPPCCTSDMRACTCVRDVVSQPVLDISVIFVILGPLGQLCADVNTQHLSRQVSRRGLPW